MAHVEDRWYQPKRDENGKPVLSPRGKPVMEPTSLHGKGLRYRVRYIAPDGKERSKSFPDREKKAADAFLVTTETDKLRGTYVDPRRGKLRFRVYADSWLASQTFDESSRQQLETRFRVHIHPTFGDLELSAIGPHHAREWDRKLQKANLAQSHRRVLFDHLSSVLSAAVDDERIVKNPCKARTVSAPTVDPRKLVPWTLDQVTAVKGHLPKRFRIMVDLGSGCGLRQGEIFGISVDDIDFLRGWLYVNRQIKTVRGRQVFALPKGRKTRKVPLSGELALLLAAHIDEFTPIEATLPWGVPGGDPVTVKVLNHTTSRTSVTRSSFNPRIWKPAREAAGLADSRENGMHALRHFYASVLLDAGENIKAVSEYLGHADPGFTLRTYTHLLPASETRTRKAIDQMLRGELGTSDGLATA